MNHSPTMYKVITFSFAISISLFLFLSLTYITTSSPVVSHFLNHTIKGNLYHNSTVSYLLYATIHNTTYPYYLTVNTANVITGIFTFHQVNNSFTEQIFTPNNALGVLLGAKYSENVRFPTWDKTYGLQIQIFLAVSTTLLGLYAVVFLETFKMLNKRKFKDKKYERIKYAILFVSILPFPFLISSIINLYLSSVVYQHLLLSASNFFFLANFTIPNVVPNATTSYIQNSIVIMKLVNYSYPTAKINPITPSFYENISADFIELSLSGFESLYSELFLYLGIGIGLIVLNLGIYGLYTIFTTEETSEEEGLTKVYRQLSKSKVK